MVKLDLNSKTDNIKNMMDLLVNGFSSGEKNKDKKINNEIILSEHKKTMDNIVNNKINKSFIEINVPSTIAELILLSESLSISDQDMYSFNINKLKNLIEPLKELYYLSYSRFRRSYSYYAYCITRSSRCR